MGGVVQIKLIEAYLFVKGIPPRQKRYLFSNKNKHLTSKPPDPKLS
jgi:hypothetical protein